MTHKPAHSKKSVVQRLMLMMLDAVLINLSMLLSLQLRFDVMIPPEHMMRFGHVWPILTVLCLISFWALGVYRNLWRYASMDEVIQLMAASLLGVGSTYLVGLVLYNIQGENYFMLPRTAYLMDWILLSAMVGFSRFSVRIANRFGVSRRAIPKEDSRRIMVVGAGWGGSSVIREMIARGNREGRPVIVVDDDPMKQGTHINRIPVLYGVVNIPEYAEQYDIDEIVIAIPSAKPEQLKLIMEACTATNCKLKLVPGLRDVSDGKLTLGRMRDVNIADLLYRGEVRLDMSSIEGYLGQKVVMVTGGGGSIGSELCRQIAKFQPKQIIIFDIYENNAFELYNELTNEYGDALNIKVLIGSVRDKKRLREVFSQYRPAIVFHAAAHKHVPLMEDSPAEAIKNNVFGTLNVAECCDEFSVERFVLLSTDKAVNPTNVMGATKRMTELVIQYMAKKSKTRYMAVRFGNVLGSNGSVIPLFRNQIAMGGPVRVTHPDITRYFMTIPEAAQLVLQAGAIGESGSIFVLDMGEPVKILDLARNFIRLSGLIPDVDIKIVFVGLRPGEKLYEELMMTEEKGAMSKTCHEKIFVAHPVDVPADKFEKQLALLRDTVDNHPELAEQRLHEVLPNFRYPEVRSEKAG